MHGWPGSHFEHLDIFDLYRKKYSPEDLPYHCIAVSLPGWTLSSGPPLGKDWGVEDTGRIMNKLMVGLGFGKDGYICQGGDIGSFTSKVMAGTYDEVKGVHCERLTRRRSHHSADQAQITLPSPARSPRMSMRTTSPMPSVMLSRTRWRNSTLAAMLTHACTGLDQLPSAWSLLQVRSPCWHGMSASKKLRPITCLLTTGQDR
jgi:pimeloyl-ACP methyl ester carboxylesterase